MRLQGRLYSITKYLTMIAGLWQTQGHTILSVAIAFRAVTMSPVSAGGGL